MSGGDQYDYLSGIVTVERDAPLEWRGDAVLPFWMAPNDPRWGRSLSRVLYHESIHFWQFLNSPYLIRIVGRLWDQLLHYEATGELSLHGSLWQEVGAEAPTAFSNYELVECWARYWDVHNRSPLEIIREEAIASKGAPLEHQGYYNHHAYDLVMTDGPKCKLYARPYRWLLDTCEGDSLLASVVFPIITNAAFTTLNPAGFFHESLRLGLASGKLRERVGQYRGREMPWWRCRGSRRPARVGHRPSRAPENAGVPTRHDICSNPS
jgi:hypothetical protein